MEIILKLPWKNMKIKNYYLNSFSADIRDVCSIPVNKAPDCCGKLHALQ